MLHELFKQVLQQYREAYQTKTSDPQLQSLLLRDLPEALIKSAAISSDYKVYGTIGAGGWPEVPWVAICDREITTTTKEGYYLVYLFDAEMTGLFLSFALGYTQFENICKLEKMQNIKRSAREMLQKQSHDIYMNLDSIPKEFHPGIIDLHATQDLGKGYEVGQIFSRYYNFAAFPSDEVLLKDLHNALSAYRELKKKIGKSYVNPIWKEVPAVESVSEIHLGDLGDIKGGEAFLKPVEHKSRYTYAPKEKGKYDEEKEKAKQLRNSKAGKAAEKIVLEYEKQRLSKLGRVDLIKGIVHVGSNNTYGFDIISFDADGKERQIEVKGSTGEPDDFFLSGYEYCASKKCENYYLYIVHNVGSPKRSVSEIRHPKFESPYFDIEPTNYVVRIRL